MKEHLLTPAQAAHLLHNLRRLKSGYHITSMSAFCTDLVGAEAADRLALIINQLANGHDDHVTLLNAEHPAKLGLLHQLSIAGVRVIGHPKMTFYRIDRERLFEQISIFWRVPYFWVSQLIVRQPVPQKDYAIYIQGARWKLTREAVLRRDKHACVRCGRTHVRLEVHHQTYAHLGDEPLDDLITLCRVDHNKEHLGKAFGEVMREVQRG